MGCSRCTLLNPHAVLNCVWQQDKDPVAARDPKGSKHVGCNNGLGEKRFPRDTRAICYQAAVVQCALEGKPINPDEGVLVAMPNMGCGCEVK